MAAYKVFLGSHCTYPATSPNLPYASFLNFNSHNHSGTQPPGLVECGVQSVMLALIRAEHIVSDEIGRIHIVS